MGVTVPVPDTPTVRSRRCTASGVYCPMAGTAGPDGLKKNQYAASRAAAAIRPRRSHFFPFLLFGR